MDPALRAIAAFLSAVVGLAFVSVLFSRNSDAANIIGTSGQAVSSILEAATAPVTGGSVAGGASFTGSPLSLLGGLNLGGIGALAGGALVGGIGALAGGGNYAGKYASQTSGGYGGSTVTGGGYSGGGFVDSGSF